MVYQTTQQQRTYLMPRAARAKTVLARGFSSCISTRPRFIGKSQVVVRPHVDCMYISTSMPATTTQQYYLIMYEYILLFVNSKINKTIYDNLGLSKLICLCI